jgi:pectate lyase
LLVLAAVLLAGGATPDASAESQAAVSPATHVAPAFQGALGWASTTPGGRGGAIVKVTTLEATGPGSFLAALEMRGPRIIVFEVGGIIDLGGRTVRVTEPFLTIAGQTAPSPGVTFIRGGFDLATHDVIIRHIRVRAGSAGAPPRSGRDFDSISTIGASNVIVDHCSLTWGTDENLSASGPRFTGSTPAEWRAGASHAITFSNNIIAESLANSTHAKGEHSKGSLIHDNASQILIVGNLYAHNNERNPLFKGGVQGVIVNNLIYNPGQRAIHYNLMANEWGARTPLVGQMVVVGNVMRAGPDTPADMAFVMLGGDGDLEFHGRDNIAQDRLGRSMALFGRYTAGPSKIISRSRPMLWPEGLTAAPASAVERQVLTTAGARPWDRDAHDVRILADTAEGRGRIIDNEAEVGGYPVVAETRRAFDPAQWDLSTMAPRSPDALDSGAKARGT